MHRHHLLGEDLHLLLDFFGLEAAELEPAEEAEVVVTALVAHLHDRVDDVLLGAVDGDFALAQHLRRHFFVEVEHRLVEPCHNGAEAEWPVIIELQFDCPCCALECLLLLTGAGDVEVAAGHDPAPLLGVPTELEPAAVVHVGETRLFRRLVVDLDVAAQAVVRFGDHHPVDPVLGREFE